jgi:hypothetical protein
MRLTKGSEEDYFLAEDVRLLRFRSVGRLFFLNLANQAGKDAIPQCSVELSYVHAHVLRRVLLEPCTQLPACVCVAVGCGPDVGADDVRHRQGDDDSAYVVGVVLRGCIFRSALPGSSWPAMRLIAQGVGLRGVGRRDCWAPQRLTSYF